MAKLTAKNFKYTHYMTLKEWIQWKKNFDNYKELTNRPKKYKDILSYDSFHTIINQSFHWDKTPQGIDYWYEISNRTSPINQKKPCKK